MIRFVISVFLLLIPALWFSDWNFFTAETTVYSVYCGKDVGDHGPCIDLPPITYQASPDRQEVAYWTDTGSPTTLTDCAVRDHKNWGCWYKNKGGRLAMADGKFHDNIRDAILDRDVFESVRYVPKWKWWAIKIGVRTE